MYILIYILNIDVRVSDDFNLFVQVPVMLIFNGTNRKLRPLVPIAGLEPLNANIVLHIMAHPPHFEQGEKRVTLPPCKAMHQ